MKVLLDYQCDPHQENDQGLSPIHVCKHQEILRLLRGEGPRRDTKESTNDEDEEEEEEEEEDVFVPKEKRIKTRDLHIKSGSKGSSRSSGDSFYEEDFLKDPPQSESGVVGTPEGVGVGAKGFGAEDVNRGFGHTPKSRPRGALYSELSSSESEAEAVGGECRAALPSDPPRKSGGRAKVRYQLAKMGEAKQKLLGKLEESGEMETSACSAPPPAAAVGVAKDEADGGGGGGGGGGVESEECSGEGQKVLLTNGNASIGKVWAEL